MSGGDRLPYGVVAIGRNEGERLKRCLASASDAALIVYVDSGSTDGSVAWATSRGIDVVELDLREGFTAARARNAGFARLRDLAPHLSYVQFVDGDCELATQWLGRAALFLDIHERVGAVFGRRRERFPEQSVYNRLCDREWNVPIGEANQCGGDVMMRVSAIEMVGGYQNELIAGEEPELCLRLRRAGWSIWRLDQEMTLHDAAVTTLRQWWLRMVRSGYAFAQVSFLHASSKDKLWVWESCRAWIWGIFVPIACAAAMILLGTKGLSVLLVYPIQLLRRILSLQGALGERASAAFFELLARFPEAAGQIKFLRDRVCGFRSKIIEYK